MTLRGVVLTGVACLSLASAIGLQILRDRWYPRSDGLAAEVLYVGSGEAMKRIALEFDALAADVYWIRAIQYYGANRLAPERRKHRFELLYPVLDIATTLDPYFNIAYRFGAIFLGEEYPGGPGRPDQAIALLEKGIAARPDKWQYYLDAGFVYYFRLEDYASAAAWFERAAGRPGAPNWLHPLAATMLTHGENRAAARLLWQQLLASEQEWLRRRAERGLVQLDALDQIDRLQSVVASQPPPQGEQYSWIALVRNGTLPGVPVDPSRTPYELDPVTGTVSVSRRSQLFPMPGDTRRANR